MTRSLNPTPLFAPPSDLGEGVLWHPTRQTLCWVDITGHRIHEMDTKTARVRSHQVSGFPSSLIPTSDGAMLVLRCDGVYRFDPDRGETRELSRLAPDFHDPTLLRFNDAKCDPRGRLWAGTIAYDTTPGAAALYRFESPTSLPERVRSGVTISNGLAWSPDGRTLYYIDSPTRQVVAFDYDLATGSITRERIAIDLTSTPGVPDGCTIDAKGNLWIAHWGGSRVTCWEPDTAQLLHTVPLSASQVSNCTFGGPKLNRLYVTTASIGLDEAAAQAEPLAGYLFEIRPNVTGLAANAANL